MWNPQLLLFIAACTAAIGCVASAVRPDAAPMPSSSTITATEIQRTSASNLYDAIVQLQPGFFMLRGSTSLLNEPDNALLVIVDRRAIGGLIELTRIPAALTVFVKRLTAAAVFHLTGLSAPSGGVEIALGRSPQAR